VANVSPAFFAEVLWTRWYGEEGRRSSKALAERQTLANISPAFLAEVLRTRWYGEEGGAYFMRRGLRGEGRRLPQWAKWTALFAVAQRRSVHGLTTGETSAGADPCDELSARTRATTTTAYCPIGGPTAFTNVE
jgi:hypothetical protein